jgi:hypothetical protein
MVLLLLILAVIPAWSVPALPDCCARAANAPALVEAKHAHCAGMSMAQEPDSASQHERNHSGSAISKVQANCRCTMATAGGGVAPLPNTSNQEILPAVRTSAVVLDLEFISRLNNRSHSERGPPALL